LYLACLLAEDDTVSLFFPQARHREDLGWGRDGEIIGYARGRLGGWKRHDGGDGGDGGDDDDDDNNDNNDNDDNNDNNDTPSLLRPRPEEKETQHLLSSEIAGLLMNDPIHVQILLYTDVLEIYLVYGWV